MLSPHPGENQRALGDRPGQHLERHLGQHAERPQAAGHQARYVVASDVLHHLAAEIEHLSGAINQLHAEHEVAHAARLLTARPGQASRDTTADRSTSGASTRPGRMRRLAGQHLPLLGQRGFHFGERRCRSGR